MMINYEEMKLSAGFYDFIDDKKIRQLVNNGVEDKARVREIIAKSMKKLPLSVEETAMLIAAKSPEMVEEIFAAARKLKLNVYGNRIVIFAPLYIGNYCVNDCKYCAFRKSNKDATRITLQREDIIRQVESLEDNGHKRLILVYGEHPAYDAEFIANSVREVYAVRKGNGEIRRVNINAAPLDYEGYKKVKKAGIGTYQIFMETYDHEIYKKMHPQDTLKGNYAYRLDGLTRAFEAGIDDVGIGALFGLADWRFDLLGLVIHSLFLQEKFSVGPHTISFPRIQPAQNVELDEKYAVSDYDFKRIVAILRLAVPYTGLILTARESPEIRSEVMEFGVSQIDAGTRIELDGKWDKKEQSEGCEQFRIGDLRSLDDTLCDLLKDGYLPSFCTACYREGRTGEEFMEYAIPGFIQNFCTPNAMLTMMEYLYDYALAETKVIGEKVIYKHLQKLKDKAIYKELDSRLQRISKDGEHDLYF